MMTDPAVRLSEIVSPIPKDGNALRWGLALASGGEIDATRDVLSELGCGNAIPKKHRAIDLKSAMQAQIERIERCVKNNAVKLSCCVDAVLWAYALPAIKSLLGESESASLHKSLNKMLHLSESMQDHSGLTRLIGGGELGLVLAWRHKKSASPAEITAAVACVKQWCESPEASIGNAVRYASVTLAPVDAALPDTDELVTRPSASLSRVALASLIRSRSLCNVFTKHKLKKIHIATIHDLAIWVAASTRIGGVTAFSTATSRDVRDDTVKHGLLDHTKTLDPESLGPAVDAAAGRSHSGGRLAWEISLPEPFCHSELGGTAILLPEWDVRRGRVELDYSQREVRLKVDAGKTDAIDGVWEVLIEVDGQEQAAAGPWAALCDYTDDDVHYLELEQRWTGEIRVQRHVLMIREDRCVLLADTVIREPGQEPATIGYMSRIKLASELVPSPETETTEVWLCDAKGEKRGLAISLQSGEWRVGPTNAKMDVTSDGHLRLEVRSHRKNGHGGNVFAPLWLDFQQRRFKRPRTWRQLTVAEELRIVNPDESAAYRVQLGSEQWVLYRMMAGDRTRTFLGKHLLADMFCARFHAGDGSMEDLVTVGGNEDDEDESGQ